MKVLETPRTRILDLRPLSPYVFCCIASLLYTPNPIRDSQPSCSAEQSKSNHAALHVRCVEQRRAFSNVFNFVYTKKCFINKLRVPQVEVLEIIGCAHHVPINVPPARAGLTVAVCTVREATYLQRREPLDVGKNSHRKTAVVWLWRR